MGLPAPTAQQVPSPHPEAVPMLRPKQTRREVARLQFRNPEGQTIFVNRTAPRSICDALHGRSWEKSSFEVRALIGKTQVVWVYDATCKLSGETVALKCYRKELQSAINYQQVEREMNVQALLNHAHILRVYGAFEDDTFIYMVQQLADKGDIYKAFLAQRVRLSETELVVKIIEPLLRALEHAHAQGVIHRDIKPENVFLHSSGILLGDWGLGIDNVQERPVSRVGTLDYMAPEVLSAPSLPPGVNFRVPGSAEAGSYDPTVDLYAVGAIAYEFIYGRPPYYRRDRAEKKSLILKGVLTFNTSFSLPAQQFIQQAMHMVPSSRGTATALLAHPWIVHHTGGALKAHWASPEPMPNAAPAPRPARPASAAAVGRLGGGDARTTPRAPAGVFKGHADAPCLPEIAVPKVAAPHNGTWGAANDAPRKLAPSVGASQLELMQLAQASNGGRGDDAPDSGSAMSGGDKASHCSGGLDLLWNQLLPVQLTRRSARKLNSAPSRH